MVTEQIFRKSFYETELDSIDEFDPVRFSYVSTVHGPVQPTMAANHDEDADSDTCIVGKLVSIEVHGSLVTKNCALRVSLLVA
jgi:hypothetical protein